MQIKDRCLGKLHVYYTYSSNLYYYCHIDNGIESSALHFNLILICSHQPVTYHVPTLDIAGTAWHDILI